MKMQPEVELRKLAAFMGKPFTVEEEERWVVAEIVKLCSFEFLSSLEDFKYGQSLVKEYIGKQRNRADDEYANAITNQVMVIVVQSDQLFSDDRNISWWMFAYECASPEVFRNLALASLVSVSSYRYFHYQMNEQCVLCLPKSLVLWELGSSYGIFVRDVSAKISSQHIMIVLIIITEAWGDSVAVPSFMMALKQ
ncbi:cytosolic sulfotransferase 5-like protein [Tanacetum coccineum]